MTTTYESERSRLAEVSRKRSAEGREVGPLPKVANARRKKACRTDLRLFCEKYLAGRFPLAWCDDHLKCIGRMQEAVTGGGRFAFAMPRGSGKTSLCEAAALWAVLYGHRSFVVLIGATAEAAKELLAAVKVELETNDTLAADFPEVCHPIRMLEGMNNRANGQTLGGERTRITFTDEEVVLPTVPGSPASGAVLRAAGLTGRIRGMKHSGAEGKSIRPDLVVIDDPQTDESAASPTQNSKRERLLSGAVLGLAGPRVKISAVMPCTVIFPNDMADRILNRETHPEWNGERTKMVYAFPTAQKLWDEYAEVRAGALRDGKGLTPATAFYCRNRQAMDAGAVVAWSERFNPDEASAVQHAMNLRLSDLRSFQAEYQNEPVVDGLGAGAKELVAASVADRCNGVERGQVPAECTRLTAFFDVGGELCWYVVCGWDERFSGAVVDYGCWPRQNRTVFEARDARPGLSEAYPGYSESQRVFAGLRDLTGHVLGRPYFRAGGGELKIERALADRGWQPDAVTKLVRASPFAGLLMPSIGIGRTTTRTGVSEWRPRPGERSGYHWRVTVGEGGRGRMTQFDPDAWKTFLWERLTTPLGGAGALTLPGKSSSAHALLSEHCAAEYAEPVTIRGATFDKWQVRPVRPDNHLWDCYSEDMEVLTRNGWSYFSELTGDEDLGTVNLETDLIEYQQPTELIGKPYRGEMVQIGGGPKARLDLCVTPTHRMVVYAGQSSRGPVIKAAADLTIWDKVKTRARWAGDGRTTFTIPATARQPEVTVPAVAAAAFFGWYIAEGSCGIVRSPTGVTHRVQISQIAGPKRSLIRDVAAQFPWRHHESAGGFVFSNEQAYRLVKVLGDRSAKRVPQWIKDAGPDVIGAFIKSAVDGDGWRYGKGEAYATINRALAGDMQELYLKAGYATSMGTKPAKPYTIRGRSGWSSEQFHVFRKTSPWCHLRDSKNRPIFRRVPYEGLVYCASVPNGTLIVRRNGKVAVCGNCLVGCAVAASVAGVRWEPSSSPTGPAPERQGKKGVDFAELVRRNRAAKQGRR